MRKILTKEEKERKETRNKTVIGIILVGIMILSTAGYALYSVGREEVKKINYRGIEFVLEEDGLWHFNIQNQEFSTFYNPKQTENISASVYLSVQNYAGKTLYFSYDSDREGVEEIDRNINRFVARTQFACLDECEENFPVKTCDDNIIIIEAENKEGESLIRQENNCIYILAKRGDVTRMSDAFIFKILKI